MKSVNPPVALLLAIASGTASAQALPAPLQRAEIVIDAPLLTHAMPAFDLAFDAPELAFAAAELAGERVVKGAPYCADALHETVQWLPDASGAAANRIIRQNRSRLCRDGEGRTRQEVDRSGRKLVYLRDPPAREAWLLDVERKTARRIARGGVGGALPLPDGADGGAWRDYGERLREWARGVAERARGVARPGAAPEALPALPRLPASAAMRGGSETEVVTIVRRHGEAGTAPQREAEVHVLRLPAGAEGLPPPAVPPLPPAVSWTARTLAPRGAGVVTSLGSQEIDGLRVTGERTSWTIEAGKVGNEKPIVIVREVWTSPELMLTVQTRDFDPRRGERNYRLVNLRRSEPDPALMKVPADYAKADGARGRH